MLGWPDRVIDAFEDGFPENWLSVLGSSLQLDARRPPNSNKSSKKSASTDSKPIEKEKKHQKKLLQEKPTKRDSLIDDKTENSPKEGSIYNNKENFNPSQSITTRRSSPEIVSKKRNPPIKNSTLPGPKKPTRRSLPPSHRPFGSSLEEQEEEAENVLKDWSKLPTSRSGRRIVPPLAFWMNIYKKSSITGEAVIIKADKPSRLSLSNLS